MGKWIGLKETRQGTQWLNKYFGLCIRAGQVAFFKVELREVNGQLEMNKGR